MSDETPMGDETPEQSTPEDGAARRASATSRARRIGGRPVRTGTAGSAPRSETVLEPEAATEPAAGVRFDKPAATESRAAAESEPAVRLDEPAAPAAAGRAGRPLLVWAPAALLTVAALVFGVLIAVFAATDSGNGGSATQVGTQGQAQRERVLAAAKNCLAQANSYDYRTMQASEIEALKCATGGYARDLRATFEKSLKIDAPKVHAVQSVQVDVAGIEAVSKDGRTWTVLLFGQVTINKTGQSGSRVDPVAAKATMQQVGGKWLIAKLDRA